MANLKQHKLGWIGIGRMGYAMALLLAKKGCDLSVWNRTRAKAEPLKEYGAKVVDAPSDLAFAGSLCKQQCSCCGQREDCAADCRSPRRAVFRVVK